MSTETRSAWEIERAKGWIERGLSGPNARTPEERIRHYMLSLMMGMWPNETWEECQERRGLTDFITWIYEQGIMDKQE